MISLHVTVYTTHEGDKYKAFIADEKGEATVDVTDKYTIAACADPVHGEGFVVLKKPEHVVAQQLDPFEMPIDNPDSERGLGGVEL